MNGCEVYEFGLSHVPAAMKKCWADSRYATHKLSKIVIHRANVKMDEAIGGTGFVNCIMPRRLSYLS